MKPMEIERRSFEIITEELGDRKPDPEFELVVKRVIHTTADFDYYGPVKDFTTFVGKVTEKSQ